MTLPNFFIIGAQKAGTTSLYHYLSQHPQVYMSPVKEPRFFSHELDPAGRVVERTFGGPVQSKTPRVSNLDEYEDLFSGASGQEAVGEASPLYIYAPGTAERIKKHVPDAKIIALLRNPVDRAYSSFLNAIRYGGEKLTDFSVAVREEERRIHEDWYYSFHYRARGLYYEQICRYHEVFGRDNVRVWLYEDLRDDPLATTRSALGFLGLDDPFVPDTSLKHNPASVPGGAASRAAIKAMDRVATAFIENFTTGARIYPIASKVRQQVQKRIVSRPEPMDPALRDTLCDYYTRDIEKLQDLIGRDLSMWLKPHASPESPTANPSASTTRYPARMPVSDHAPGQLP